MKKNDKKTTKKPAKKAPKKEKLTIDKGDLTKIKGGQIASVSDIVD